MHRVYDVRIVVECKPSKADGLPDTDDVCDAIGEMLDDAGEVYALLPRGAVARYVGVRSRDRKGAWKGPWAAKKPRPAGGEE